MKIKITRFVDQPIIPPFLEQEIGSNINGPSLIKVPDWIEDSLGKYYLYFADHKGDRIKLAYSNKLEGQWKILSGGTLKLENSYFLNEKPSMPHDFNIKHIASTDAHVVAVNQRIVLYFHGLDEFGIQKTRVATSCDGINFKAKKKIVGWPYFRKFTYKADDYAISMPGFIYKNNGDIEDFTIINQVMEEDTRHSAVMVYKDQLLIFHTRKGDKPERILLSIVDLSLPSNKWDASKPIEVLKPEKDWEGAFLPNYESVESAINIPVNQLRDPAIFFEDDKNYLLYSLRGENGIGIVEFSIEHS